MKAEWTNSDSLTTSQTTKAILVIDKPKDCFTCELGGSKVCIGGCPLKPMLIKQDTKSTIGIDLVDSFKDGWNYGWNACIDEILGETE